MNSDPIEVGKRIKGIRLNNGLTMEELGNRLDTSKGAVNNWEKGKSLPNKERISKIAKLGDISVDELLYGDITNYVHNIIWNHTFDEETGIETGVRSKEYFEKPDEATDFLNWFNTIYLPQHDFSKESYPSYNELLNEFRSYMIEDPDFNKKERIVDILDRMKINIENSTDLTLKSIFKQDIEELEKELDL